MWKWSARDDKHCSDETLIALADGELSRWRQWRVRRHLEACWQCRARYHEADEQTRLVASFVSKTNYPGPGRVASARDKVLKQAGQIERESPPTPRFRSESSRAVWPVLVAATATVALVIVFALTWHTELPEADDILLAATAYEDRQAQQPLEQVLSVSLTSPETDRSGEIRVWSHGAAAKFVSRWRDEAGGLRHAVWRDTASKVYIYNAHLEARVSERRPTEERFSAIDFATTGVDGEDLEQGLMRWIESRSWRPLSLARGVMHLASDGYELEVRQTHSEISGGKALRVTARKQNSRRVVELHIEVEPDTYRPVFEQIRISDSTGTVAFSITPKRTRPIAARLRGRIFSREWVQNAVFGRNLRIPGSPKEPEPTKAPVVSRTTQPSESDLLAIELEVRYALHRVGACLGEPVRVLREEPGKIVVSGLVDDVDRQRQLITALAEVEETSRVRIDIRTISEVEASDTRQLPQQRLVVGPNEAGGARLQIEATDGVPLEAPLREYYEERGLSRTEAAAQVVRTSDRAVGLAEAILAEAWALRRLAEAFSPRKIRELPSRGRWLLEVMLGDHMRSIASGRGRLRRSLNGPIVWLAGEQPSQLPGLPEQKAADWESHSIRVFESVSELHRSVLAALASGGATATAPPEDLATALARRLTATRRELTTLDQQLAAEFPGNPRRLSSRTTTNRGSTR